MMKKYILPICLVIYVGIMFFVSSVYYITIMDPVGFLWIFCFFITGPIIFLISLIIGVRKLIGKHVSTITLVTVLLCLVLVPTWTFGFWVIGSICRPIMFSLVAEGNTILAESEMKENTEGEQFSLHGFRYPFFKLPARARHHDGTLFITISGGPGLKDTIIYDPQETCNHAKYQHLTGAWWISGYIPEQWQGTSNKSTGHIPKKLEI
jgi:uncharacterized membrane protein YhaH (DUF805 family)